MTTDNRSRNSAKRLPIVCVIDISPSTMMKGDFGNQTANALINKHLRLFINQLLANPKIKASGEICFISYSTDVTVTEFVPIKNLENKMPKFDAVTTGGTRTVAALDAAYAAIRKRTQEITSHATVGTGMYTPVVFLLTDGDASQHDDPAYRDRVTKMMNECTLKKEPTQKVLPFIVGLGSHIGEETKKMLAGFSKGFINGYLYLPGNSGDADKDYSALFHFISESLVTSIRYEDESSMHSDGGTKPSLSEEPLNADEVDYLLDELRELIYEEYPEMVCTVTND